MGWERRGNGMYYYTKVREGGKVSSRYAYGGGHFGGMGETFQLAQQAGRRRKEREREALRKEQEEFREIEQGLSTINQMIQQELAAVLIANGYHNHKGQWRKHREPRSIPDTHRADQQGERFTEG